MRPTSLAVRGLKCWGDRTLELGRLTAIHGPNGSGKSAFLQAIRLAMIGYDPGTGRQLEKTRKLIAPDAEKGTAEIGLSFDSGFGIRRRFGAKTETQVFPSLGETTVAECQQRINEETGGLLVALDEETFFGLSPEKRRAWIFEHLPKDSAELTWHTFAEWTDAGGPETHLGEVVRNLWEHNVQAAPNPVTGLGSAIEAARREFLEADGKKRAQREVVDRGAELTRQDPAPDPVPEEELTELEQRLAAVNQRIGQTRAGREAREAIENRLSAASGRHGTTAGEIGHAENVLKDVDEQLEALAAPPELVDRTDELFHLEESVKDLQDAQQTLTAKHASTRAAATVLLEQAHKLGEHGACPYAALGCQQDTEAMKEHVLQGIEEQHVDAVADLDEAAAADAKGLELLESTRNLAAIVRTAGTDEEQLHRRLTTLHQDLGQRQATQRSVLVELRERLEIHDTAAKAAKAELDALGSDDALEGLYRERDEAEQARGVLQTRLALVARYAERLEAHDREAKVLEEREERSTALKELDGNLRRLRGHVIEKMIEPLQEEAATILASMDPKKSFRFIFERGNASTLELCFVEDGITRLYDAASTGERVMLTVAFIGAALAVIDPPMRLLLIDNLEQLDTIRRAALMEGLAKLEDRFDAVIVAGACALGGIDGWDLVTLHDKEKGVLDVGVITGNGNGSA